MLIPQWVLLDSCLDDASKWGLPADSREIHLTRSSSHMGTGETDNNEIYYVVRYHAPKVWVTLLTRVS